MALQNRVTPLGDIVATPERGTLFGNRGGRFHDPLTRRLTGRRFASRRWICCELSFKSRRRTVFGQGFTELFFLDEATALAAGHRPCFECRRVDAILFREAYARGNRLGTLPLADEMDLRLHAERRSRASRSAIGEPCRTAPWWLTGASLAWSSVGSCSAGRPPAICLTWGRTTCRFAC